MKVINFLGNKIGSGGIESFVASASEGMIERDIEFIILINYKTNNIYEHKIVDNGAKIVYLLNKKGSYIRKLIAFSRYIKKDRDAIIYLHASTQACYIHALIARAHGIKKIVYHIHSTPPPFFGGLKKIKNIILDIFLNRIPRIKVACSLEAGEYYYHGSPFKVILNGIDLERFKFSQKNRYEVRQELNCGDKLVIGQIGRLAYQKNQIHTLQVLKKYIHEVDQNVMVVLIGEGADEEMLKDFVSQHHLESYVVFIPPTECIEKYYHAMDLLMFPSIYEGLGIVAIEAQAAGLPILCSERIVDEVFITNLAKRIELNDMDLWVDNWKSISQLVLDREESSNLGISKAMQAGFSLKYLRNSLIEIYRSV